MPGGSAHYSRDRLALSSSSPKMMLMSSQSSRAASPSFQPAPLGTIIAPPGLVPIPSRFIASPFENRVQRTASASHPIAPPSAGDHDMSRSAASLHQETRNRTTTASGAAMHMQQQHASAPGTTRPHFYATGGRHQAAISGSPLGVAHNNAVPPLPPSSSSRLHGLPPSPGDMPLERQLPPPSHLGPSRSASSSKMFPETGTGPATSSKSIPGYVGMGGSGRASGMVALGGNGNAPPITAVRAGTRNRTLYGAPAHTEFMPSPGSESNSSVTHPVWHDPDTVAHRNLTGLNNLKRHQDAASPSAGLQQGADSQSPPPTTGAALRGASPASGQPAHRAETASSAAKRISSKQSHEAAEHNGSVAANVKSKPGSTQQHTKGLPSGPSASASTKGNSKSGSTRSPSTLEEIDRKATEEIVYGVPPASSSEPNSHAAVRPPIPVAAPATQPCGRVPTKEILVPPSASASPDCSVYPPARNSGQSDQVPAGEIKGSRCGRGTAGEGKEVDEAGGAGAGTEASASVPSSMTQLPNGKLQLNDGYGLAIPQMLRPGSQIKLEWKKSKSPSQDYSEDQTVPGGFYGATTVKEWREIVRYREQDSSRRREAVLESRAILEDRQMLRDRVFQECQSLSQRARLHEVNASNLEVDVQTLANEIHRGETEMEAARKKLESEDLAQLREEACQWIAREVSPIAEAVEKLQAELETEGKSGEKAVEEWANQRKRDKEEFKVELEKRQSEIKGLQKGLEEVAGELRAEKESVGYLREDNAERKTALVEAKEILEEQIFVARSAMAKHVRKDEARADAEQQLADAAREKTRAAEKELEQDLAKFEKCKEQRAAQAEKVDSKLAELSKAAELLEVTRKEVVDAMAEVNKNHISKWKEASMSRWASGGSNKVTPASTPTGASSLRGATPSQGFVQDFSRPQSFSRGSPTETRNSAFKESTHINSPPEEVIDQAEKFLEKLENIHEEEAAALSHFKQLCLAGVGAMDSIPADVELNAAGRISGSCQNKMRARTRFSEKYGEQMHSVAESDSDLSERRSGDGSESEGADEEFEEEHETNDGGGGGSVRGGAERGQVEVEHDGELSIKNVGSDETEQCSVEIPVEVEIETVAGGGGPGHKVGAGPLHQEQVTLSSPVEVVDGAGMLLTSELVVEVEAEVAVEPLVKVPAAGHPARPGGRYPEPAGTVVSGERKNSLADLVASVRLSPSKRGCKPVDTKPSSEAEQFGVDQSPTPSFAYNQQFPQQSSAAVVPPSVSSSAFGKSSPSAERVMAPTAAPAHPISNGGPAPAASTSSTEPSPLKPGNFLPGPFFNANGNAHHAGAASGSRRSSDTFSVTSFNMGPFSVGRPRSGTGTPQQHSTPASGSARAPLKMQIQAPRILPAPALFGGSASGIATTSGSSVAGGGATHQQVPAGFHATVTSQQAIHAARLFTSEHVDAGTHVVAAEDGAIPTILTNIPASAVEAIPGSSSRVVIEHHA